eukprot:256893_1
MKRIICLLTLVIVVIRSQTPSPTCAESEPSGWTEEWCPEDITRIEYQIPIDEQILIGDGTLSFEDGTVKQIDDFLDWIIDNYQNNEFRLRTNKIKKYKRTVETLKITKNNNNGAVKPPQISSIKYRRSFGSFQNTHSTYGDSKIKHTNDLTFESPMSTPGTDIDFKSVTSTYNYSHIFGTKLEPNVFVDTCTTNWFQNNPYIYGIQTTGFSAKVEFDEDISIVPDGTDGAHIINTLRWINADTDFYCDTCGGTTPYPCICCEIEEYIDDYCSHFNVATTSKRYRYSSKVDYVLDIDLYWYKDANYDYQCNDDNTDVTDDCIDATSEGKLTFQVRYNDVSAMNNNIPNDASTELSVKLYKSDTIDGEWQNIKQFAEQFIDALVSDSGAIWIDKSMCASGCCTDLAAAPKWDNQCAAQLTQNDCSLLSDANGNDACKWIPCNEVGDCEYDGNGNNDNLLKQCPRKKTQIDCEAHPSNHCFWTLKYP